MDQPNIKDSGTRRNFDSGAVRDAETGKGRFDLIPPVALELLAKHFEAGALKYDARNWEKGMPLSQFLDSALRHINKYRDGQRDEPHIVAAFWNLAAFLHTREMVNRGILPEELDDLPKYKKSNPQNLPHDPREAAMLRQQKFGIGFPLPSFLGFPPFNIKCTPAESPKKITAYLSHPIRGRTDGRSEEQRVKENCEDAIRMAIKLRKKFPNLDLYCPAEHGLSLQIALKRGLLSIDDVLEIDCEIVKRCKWLFLYMPDQYISEGMAVERDFAVKHQITYLAFEGSEESLKNIGVFLGDYE